MRQITLRSQEVTTFENAPGVISKVAEMTAPVGVTYIVTPPLEMLLKLYDVDGNQIPPQSEIFLAHRSPKGRYPIFFFAGDYTTYYDLDAGQQLSAEYAGRTLIRTFDGVGQVRVQEGAHLELHVNTFVQVDMDSLNARMEYGVSEQ